MISNKLKGIDNFLLRDVLLVICQFILIILHLLEVRLIINQFSFANLSFFNIFSIIVIFLGLFFILLSIKELGANISPLPKPKSKANLISSGLYKNFSHPIYFSLILISLGLLIYKISIKNFILSFLLIGILKIKINIEEKYLSNKFSNYKKYKSTVSF